MENWKEELVQKGNQFLCYIFDALGNQSFLTDARLDHICYRTETNEEYFTIKEKLCEVGTLVSANQVKGREITIVEMPFYFMYNSFKTNLLELTQTKNDRKDKLGFEHIELISNLELRTIIEKNTHLNFNSKNIDTTNPEIRLNFQKGSVKVRNLGIKQILQAERI